MGRGSQTRNIISKNCTPLQVLKLDFINYRSRCHGNGHLSDDSKYLRSIPIALRVILNPVDVCGGQSARGDKSHTCMYMAGRVHVTINPIHVRCGHSARKNNSHYMYNSQPGESLSNSRRLNLFLPKFESYYPTLKQGSNE